jgi:DNA replication protein DnaC
MNNNYKTDDTNLNDFIFCTEELGVRPSKVVLAYSFKPEEFNKILNNIKHTMINSLLEFIPDIEGNIVNEKYLVKIDNYYLSYTHMDSSMPTGFIINVIIYHKLEDINEVKKFVESLETASIKITEEESSEEAQLTYLSNGQTGLNLEKLEPIQADYENFDLYFNDDTLKSAKKFIKKINKSDKGLSIIYGKRGSGKTTLLSNICLELEKKIIFIPISTIDLSVNTGAIKNFIAGHEMVLVIDDCEILNADMFGKSSLTFANLLQLIDGFYSDEFSLHIILCFNVENEDDIDEELLESNNLLSILKVEELKKAKVKELCEHLKMKTKIEEPTLLIDIINNRIEDKLPSIGF